ncbi:MAG: type II secretion system F family protein [Candidatus Pacebacteria bacterium]|nr:type II secretion system F family protein [Candidatus Paceibacterota bacterium]
MARFKFKAIKKTGEKYSGIRESSDKFSLYAELKFEGDTLVSASEVSHKTYWFTKIAVPFRSVPEHQKIIFAKNLGTMIEAGLPLAKSLSVLEKQIKNKNFKNIISSLEDEIRKGKTLSEVSRLYSDVFPNLFISMVKAGEESGKLSDSLKIVGHQMDSAYKLKKKIKGAMIYPSVILSVMIIIGIAMLVFVVPSITATFKDLNVELPLLTRILIGTSDFLKNNIFVSLISIIVIFIIFYFFSLSKTGKRSIDFVILGLPVIGGLVRETNSARITRTISSLLSSGVPFAEAILITGEVIQNTYFKDILVEARVKVEKGEPISSVFLQQTKLCPVFVGEMMSVGEETGRLPSMLMEVADFYENSVDQKTKDMSTIIEPFLMIIIGLAVGFFALAMIKPIYSIMDTL